MNARILDMKARRARPRLRAHVSRVGFRLDDMRWIVSCPCGWGRVEHVRSEADRAKRGHDAEHRRAEAAHPAGKGIDRGGDPA